MSEKATENCPSTPAAGKPSTFLRVEVELDPKTQALVERLAARSTEASAALDALEEALEDLIDAEILIGEAAEERAEPDAEARGKLADAAVDLRRAALAVKAAECQSLDPHYGLCSSCAGCVAKARAKGEKSSALSRLRYWADKVIAEEAET